MATPAIVLEPCISPVWAKTGHLQTIWGHLLPSAAPSLAHENVELALLDGDRLSLHIYPGTSNTVIVLFHGFTGDTDSNYMKRTAKVATDLGHSVVLANHRGCGSGRRIARQPYHSGRAEDLSAVIDETRTRFPGKNQIAIGFSLSGNALLLLLSGKRGTSQPDAAIAVNAPIDLDRTARNLTRGWNRIYDRKFVNACRADIAFKMKHQLLNRKVTIPSTASVLDFDEIYTAIESGFQNRAEYYAHCSTHLLLDRITKPTFILTASDDPFVDDESYRQATLGPNTLLHIEKEGGHLGYLSARKTPFGNCRWLDYALATAIDALINTLGKGQKTER